MVDSEKTTTSSAAVQDMVSRLDVDAVGIANLAEWKGTKLEDTALRLLPQARSVVVFAMTYYPEILALASHQKIMGAASMNELLERHADYLNGRLTKASYDVAKSSHNVGLKALPLGPVGCPVDVRFMEAVLSFKHAGEAAGLGKIGWHSLLMTPTFGPRVRLSCCLTEAELEPTHIDMNVKCVECGICIDSCPAGALTKPRDNELYSINRFACSSYRSASGGCNECMRVCPTGDG
ncbi:4Fe-4S dicluster domain-containing protein [Chloroflexota bacterium]